jgi:Tol biopolymer transport system component
MSERCPQCGAEFSEKTSPHDLCPACLLKLGLSDVMAAVSEQISRKNPARRSFRTAWIIAGLTLFAALLILFGLVRRPSAQGRVVRFSIELPPDAGFVSPAGGTDFNVSPDGRRLVFAAIGRNGKRILWLRSLDSLKEQPLPDSEGAALPFWSPDSRSIAFFAQAKLKKIAASGGPAQTLCDAARPRGGTWSREDFIVFTPNASGGLYRIPASGVVPEQLTVPDRSRQESGHWWPHCLPDGRHFLFSAVATPADNNAVYVGAIGSKQVKLLLKGGSNARYAQGYLLFAQDRMLLAQRFDPVRFQLFGDAVPLRLDQPAEAAANSAVRFSTSEQGVLAYRVYSPPETPLAWFDRTGKILETVGPAGEYRWFSLSPDGRAVAFTRSGKSGASDTWLLDLSRNISSRFTFDPACYQTPVWSPDGRRLVLVRNQGGAGSVYQKMANGTGKEELLFPAPTGALLDGWSADGRFIVYTAQDRKGKSDLWLASLTGDRKPALFQQSAFNLKQGQFSPDMRWMAYVSDESGRDEVYVQSFPSHNAKWQVSNNGGVRPKWRGDSRELFYIEPQWKLMAAEVRADSGGFISRSARPLFTIRDDDRYVVSSDGVRFLIRGPAEPRNSAAIQVVLNWTEELRK